MAENLENLTHILANKGPIILLESQSNEHPWSRTTYLAAQPKVEIKAYGNQIKIVKEGEEYSFEDNPWNALQDFRRKYNNEWLLGYLGYDLKNYLEDLSSKNEDPLGLPDLYFMVPEYLLKKEKGDGRFEMVGGEGAPRVNPDTFSSLDKQQYLIEDFGPRVAKVDYIKQIKEAQRRIIEGDFYEINLSHQLKGAFRGDPQQLYSKMKKAGRVPFGAYLEVDDWSACCQSPERFLRREGKTIFSQPIKGTAKRGRTQQEDEDLKEALYHSSKERAENLMIVDLVRNDLSHIAKKGSVKVEQLFNIESFETVHQMVSTVMAKVAEGEDAIEILKACFPMGSMTGAPKISAMKTIEELETYKRGLYSGAIGYIKPNGDFDFNVVIRTAIIKNETLYYAVGGAITGDSDPEAEWEETLVKARALINAME
ncbi:aminodeoxychorismate synthase component I [Aliifodinibius salicampi]|uniref:aminodeoxychorismate synthase n=1 Tax=Fodinibius salicampi TaxID=1920655 RepID=A0ABT3PVY6_9BACT|nr:aminodeoxychorismate synthase component I [Fodinibius salicampi]MCW9712014.1 aminodeoxychorismate synthase component I [Fodinibius salicampi]